MITRRPACGRQALRVQRAQETGCARFESLAPGAFQRGKVGRRAKPFPAECTFRPRRQSNRACAGKRLKIRSDTVLKRPHSLEKTREDGLKVSLVLGLLSRGHVPLSATPTGVSDDRWIACRGGRIRQMWIYSRL
jgi:hypothetical protein